MYTPTASAVAIGCNSFRITGTLNRERFLLDISDLRTDELLILLMLVIFQEDEKHVIQVFC